MQSQLPGILSMMTFLPLIGALIVMFLPRPKDLPEAHGDHDDHEAHHEHAPSAEAGPSDIGRLLVNGIALTFAVLTFLLSIALFGSFQSRHVSSRTQGIGGSMQFLENVPWIHLGGGHAVRYHMGVDGISLLLILLTTFLMVLCVLFSFRTRQRLKEFMVFLLLLESGMIGLFCALDLVLFYVFFEAILIPMYFLIGIFGHENRIYAAIKFFIYTFAGSVLMLVAIVAVYSSTGSFDIVALSNPSSRACHLLQTVNPQALIWMFAAFSLAFMIKVPMFPFHTWLPDAHVEAPTAGSVLLAGVMLKIGTYGFIRICLPIFPVQAQNAAPLFIVLAIVGIVYGSIVAAVQPDAKKLVAYSSVAHLGFVMLGIFTFTRIGMMGALVQNINHGISTPMLFFIVGMMYERRHTREISQFGGLKKIVPMMATMLLIATLASLAVPFFNGFVGEFPVLLGSWLSDRTHSLGGYWPTALAATGMVLSAVYMLWWYQRLMLGPVTHPVNRRLPDLSRSEWAVLLPLAGIVFWFGLGSGFWTQRMDAAVSLLIPPTEEQLYSENPVSDVLELQSIHETPRARALGQHVPLNVYKPADVLTPHKPLMRMRMSPGVGQPAGGGRSGGGPPSGAPPPGGPGGIGPGSGRPGGPPPAGAGGPPPAGAGGMRPPPHGAPPGGPSGPGQTAPGNASAPPANRVPAPTDRMRPEPDQPSKTEAHP